MSTARGPELRFEIRGRFRDRLREPDGRTVATDWRSNAVVRRSLDLLAGLLANRPELVGHLYWAVGTGDPAWDQRAAREDPKATRLVREIYRKPLEPGREITYHPATRTLELRATFGPDEAVGELREFGIFGGDATSAADSGYLINHRIHERVDKTLPRSLERTLQLTIGPAPTIRVPALVGLTEERARAALDGANLSVGDVRTDEREANPGMVVEQDPPAGATVAPGIPVAFTVAVPISVVVPDLSGLLPAAAAAALRAATLRLSGGTPATAESDLPPGTVASQTPGAGERAPRGSAVTIALATPRTVAVPDLAGLTVDAAGTRLEQAGLLLADENPAVEERADVTPGTVVGQRPPAGGRARLGSPVSVTLAGAATTAVPNLIGLRPDEARERLAAAELRIGALAEEESDRPAGTIARQRPDARGRVPRGSTVDLVVATPTTVETPSLLGLTLQAATTRLAGSGLTLAPNPPSRESSATPNTIVAQRPVAGERAARGTQIQVVVAVLVRVEVPDLVGAALTLARELLKSVRLLVQEPPGERPVTDARPGTVLAQNPAGGSSVAVGSRVTLTVAVAGVTVPSLVGKTPEQAGTTLQGVGLGLDPAGRTERESTATEGTIVEHTPAAGQVVVRGTAVRIVVAIAPTVEVPRFIGQKVADATARARAVGLDLLVTERSDPRTPGTIVQQSPAPGTRVKVGSVVAVIVPIARER